MEPFEITTVYADGTSETRWSTPEEMAQREADLIQFETERLIREQAEADRLAAKESARNKLAALGLTEDEVSALFNL